MKIKLLLCVSLFLLSTSLYAQAPDAVTDLATSNTTETTTDLTWSTPSGTITEYRIYQNASEIVILPTPVSSYNVTGLTIDTSYDFTIIAFNNLDGSTISNTATTITSDVTPPSNVTNLIASNTSETTTDLTWDVATDNVAVTGYDVYQNTNAGGDVLIGSPATNSFSVTGLTIGDSNDFTVYAKDAAGNTSSLASNTVNVTTSDVTPPSNVTNLIASNTSETTTDLTWDVATDNVAVTGYEVYQNTNAGGDVLIGSPATNSFSVTGLTSGDSNDFTVYAKDAAGNTSSLASNTVNVTTSDVTPPIAITNLISTNTTETTTDLTWSTTDNVAVTDYEVFQDITGNGTPVSLGLTGGTASMNVTGLIIDTSYDFTVYAKDAANNTSLVSNTATVVTSDITPPAAVDDLTSSNTTHDSTTLTWSQTTDNIGVVDYEVFQDDVSIGTTSGFSNFDITGLSELTIYRFKVRAIDAAGNTSALSNVEIVETLKEGGATYYTNLNANLLSIDWAAKDLFVVGNIGVGIPPSSNYKLAINGNVIAEEVRVALQANWPDYVFEKNYELEPLDKVALFIKTYGHLKNIPNAESVEKNGIDIGHMNGLLLRKIEELTLYTIQQENKIDALILENKQLEILNNRLLEVEKLIQELKQ